MLRGKKMFILQLGNMLSSDVYWPFVTIFFSGKDNFKKQLFGKKHLLTVAMTSGRSPIKVSCEKEDLPDQENVPDFDEDTLQGELGLSLASVIVRTISFPPVSRSKQIWRRIHCTTTLNEILASHDSLLWLEYVVHWEDLWHRNLWHLLYTKL